MKDIRRYKNRRKKSRYLRKENLEKLKMKKRVKTLVKLRCGNMKEANKY